MTEPNRAKGRLTLLLIVVVFLVPVVAAYLYRPAGEAGNYGTLIEPPQPLGELEMTALDGTAAGLDALRGKWTLLYPGGERCGETCRRNLFKIERVRLTQGEDMERVQSLYLAPNSMEPGAVADALVEYQGLQGYLIAPSELASMAPALELGAGEGAPVNKERIYVIDPLGNLMMYYSRDADPSGMKEDLERLLKVSQIG